jgi:beta-xylosidase
MSHHCFSIHHPVKRFAAVLLAAALLTACAPVRPLPAPVVEPPLQQPTAPGAAQPSLPALTNPVFDRDFPDPFVLPAEDGYYAYSTNSAGRNVPVIFSRDLVTWERAGEDGDALPKLPAWAQSFASLTWAPSVLRRGDEYILYYVARFKEAGRQCISYAVAASPAGPFVDPNDRPFICQLDEGGSIDPEPFVDVDGALYLLWKSDANALNRDANLYSQRLSDDGRTLLDEPVRLISRDQEWERPLVENPSLVLQDGAYYLIYSGNWWEGGNYALGFAVCEGPSGPCTKPLDEPFFAIPTNRIGGEIGPGGGSFFRDHDGNLWIAYHAWRAPSAGYVAGGQRRLSIAPVTFADDIPTVVSPVPAAVPAP